jgi:hypothetical protein
MKEVVMRNVLRILTALTMGIASAQVPGGIGGIVPGARRAAPDCTSAGAVLEHYLSAVGGRDAIQEIHTRTSEAIMSDASSWNPQSQNHYRYSFKWKAPNKVVVTDRHVERLFAIPVPFGKWTFKYDGTRWAAERPRNASRADARPDPRGRPRPEFGAPDEAMKRIAADPLMPARPNDLYIALDSAGDWFAYPGRCALHGLGDDNRTDTLYFDAQAGFLKAWDLEMLQPPLPSFIIRFEFDDYREAGPIKFPFYVYCDFYRATFKFTSVQHNVPVRDSEFELSSGQRLASEVRLRRTS